MNLRGFHVAPDVWDHLERTLKNLKSEETHESVILSCVARASSLTFAVNPWLEPGTLVPVDENGLPLDRPRKVLP